MNSDNYKIVISLSHHRIAFEYWQRDGENRLMPVANIAWPVPLAFYCSPMGIEIGDVAVRAANAGTSNAFDDYFEKLGSDETYILGGRRQPLRYLLLDAAETMFEEFFKNDLFGSQGAFKDNKATMPVTLACEADIRSNERSLIASLFRDSGYTRFKITEYNDFIERYVKEHLAQQTPCKNVLVAWTEGSDLSLTLFDLHGNSERHQITLPGLGKDPRLEYVKHIIRERIKGQNPWLSFDFEEEAIERAAMDFLASDVPMLNDTIILSDGNSYHYSLNRAVIDNLQCDEGVEIKARMEEFLRQNGVKDKADTLLILRGMASGNIFFEQTLCPGFGQVIRSDRKLRDNVMKLLIADPNPVVIVKKQVYSEPIEIQEIEETPKPTTRKPTAPKTGSSNSKEEKSEKKGDKQKENQSPNESEGGFMTGFGAKLGASLGSAFDQLGNAAKTTFTTGMDLVGQAVDSAAKFMSTDEPAPDPAVLKKLKREWRETKAMAKGKAGVDKYDEARDILSDFLKKCRQAKAEELANEVAAELSDAVQKAKDAAKDSKVAKGGVATARAAAAKVAAGKNSASENKSGESSSRRQPTASWTAPSKAPKAATPPPVDRGRQLVAEGKLKEAREWYREKGDTSNANLVGDVIRAKRSAEMRLGDDRIETFRKSADAAKVKRVVDELEDFIAKANNIGYPTTDYRNALAQYKKMKR